MGNREYERMKTGPKPIPLGERFPKYIHFQSGVSYTGDGKDCWIWTGCVGTSGYPQLSSSGKTIFMHRWAYEEFIGRIPDGMSVLHRCDVKRCVNPEHLFIGTQRDNIRDMISKGRQRFSDMKRPLAVIVAKMRSATHCKNGHDREVCAFVEPKTGYRKCRECMRAAGRRYWERRREATA